MLPWSRTDLDSLCDLVQACAKCNSDKTDVLPSPKRVQVALGRSSVTIEEIALEVNWPDDSNRVRAIARGLCRSRLSNSSPSSYKKLAIFDAFSLPKLLL